MTYCVGLLLDAGMVLLSDTRTNAGLDNIAIYRKMFVFEDPGERIVTIMTAGSLSVTQTTIARLQEAASHTEPDGPPSVLNVPTMLQVAELVGRELSEVSADVRSKMERNAQSATATMIVAGQRKGGDMRMFLIYPEGNFIEATADTPFLQIGEHKYGKPILDRVVTPRLTLADAQKVVLLSMDSTLRSNLSVGMPLDLLVIEKDACRASYSRRIEANDSGFAAMSSAWSDALRRSFAEIAL
ncbi:peptidase [Palleronia sp. KMU-117]|uniref:peptidase n=1 Tax=Palleronia sp. KMU-117 TaxID=3434108 RepID=UPI003D731BDD